MLVNVLKNCSNWILLNVGSYKYYSLHAIPYLIFIQIFEKALDEPKYSSLYATLCHRLCEDAPNFEPPDSKISVSIVTWSISMAVKIIYFLSALLNLSLYLHFVFSRPSGACYSPSVRMNLRIDQKRGMFLTKRLTHSQKKRKSNMALSKEKCLETSNSLVGNFFTTKA